MEDALPLELWDFPRVALACKDYAALNERHFIPVEGRAILLGEVALQLALENAGVLKNLLNGRGVHDAVVLEPPLGIAADFAVPVFEIDEQDAVVEHNHDVDLPRHRAGADDLEIRERVPLRREIAELLDTGDFAPVYALASDIDFHVESGLRCGAETSDIVMPVARSAPRLCILAAIPPASTIRKQIGKSSVRCIGHRDFGAPAELIGIWDETSQPVSLRK